jgi:hypothetical protein
VFAVAEAMLALVLVIVRASKILLKMLLKILRKMEQKMPVLAQVSTAHPRAQNPVTTLPPQAQPVVAVPALASAPAPAVAVAVVQVLVPEAGQVPRHGTALEPAHLEATVTAILPVSVPVQALVPRSVLVVVVVLLKMGGSALIQVRRIDLGHL